MRWTSAADWAAPNYAAGRITEARDQFRTALAVPGADRYPREHAQAVEGLSRTERPEQ
ncbi:hypothetical protein [Streptomyces sp. AcE210]|uniref:hypothetical protein n=1 Tax=Streptomyces sp. AcE210 TaxID=2292703 RepID=UPI001404EF65|nr:hypothetical protein [Streptomyces sp. AcE210]